MSQFYHFIGIKGSGMSALALVLHQMGHYVQGSDVSEYYFTQSRLETSGIKILSFDEKNIKNGCKIIAGNAFHSGNNVEIVHADTKGLSYEYYHDFLGSFIRNFISIGVAGTHGKTSTTGMLSHILSHITNTGFLIGDGTGHGSVAAEYFVFESDEYKRHFMSYYPEYSIITNIDFDHPDYFSCLGDVFNAFNDYAKQVSNALFVHGGDKNLRKLTASVPIYYYGFEDENDFIVHDFLCLTTGSIFNIRFRGQELGRFQIPSYGRHNILNATAIISLLFVIGFDLNLVKKYLKTFPGVERRFTEKIVNGIVMIDDFAHHPTEVVATLDAARQKYPGKKIIAIFQPHTFTRTAAFLDQFAEALNRADSVYLAAIYASVREIDSGGGTRVEDLSKRIAKPSEVVTIKNLSILLNHNDAVYVFMGAGDIQVYEHAFELLLLDLKLA